MYAFGLIDGAEEDVPPSGNRRKKSKLSSSAKTSRINAFTCTVYVYNARSRSYDIVLSVSAAVGRRRHEDSEKTFPRQGLEKHPERNKKNAETASTGTRDCCSSSRSSIGARRTRTHS